MGVAGNMDQLIIYSWSVILLGVYGKLFYSGWEFLMWFHLTLLCISFNLGVHIFSNWFVLEPFRRSVAYKFFKINGYPLYIDRVKLHSWWWLKTHRPNFFFDCHIWWTNPSTYLFRILHFVMLLFGPFFF